MGASQSVDSATEHQMKEIGPFMLRSSQKGALKILSQIVQKLLTKNNLFDLTELLGSPEKCSKLFIVVSTTVKKEFQLLKFPDPRNPSHMATMSFLSQGAYPPKGSESEAARSRACNEITHFLIRLVTFATACTASISRNEQIASLLDITSADPASQGVEKYVRDIPSTISFTNAPLDQVAVTYLAPKFNQVDPKRRPNLYRFGSAYSFIVDIKKSIIYNSNTPDNRTPIFKISFKLLTNQKDLMQVSTMPTAPAAAAAPTVVTGTAPAATGVTDIVGQTGQLPPNGITGAQPAASSGATIPGAPPFISGLRMPNAGSIVTSAGSERTFGVPPSQIPSSTGPPSGASAFGMAKQGGRLRKTRGRRGALRKRLMTRRQGAHRRGFTQRGGDLKSYVECTIEETIYGEFRDCESSCKKSTFIIDNEGNTYDMDQFRFFQQSSTPMTILPSTIKSFDDRVRVTFDQITTQKVTTTEYKERTELSKDRFKPLTGASEETLKTLQDYGSTMPILPTGSAPAPYRAFMLASRMSGQELTTFFCEDTWAGQYATATIAYSLLQALYEDGRAGTIASPRSLDACKAAARQFIGAQVAVPASQTGSEVENFHNIRFSTTPIELDAFCKTRAPQTTSISADKRALIMGQKSIRELYDKHISDIVGLMKKVMYVTTDPSDPGSMNIHLNDIFNSDPAGGLAALERIINEARTLIAAHFLAVEKVYMTTLMRLGENRKGSAPPNNGASTPANLLAPA